MWMCKRRHIIRVRVLKRKRANERKRDKRVNVHPWCVTGKELLAQEQAQQHTLAMFHNYACVCKVADAYWQWLFTLGTNTLFFSSFLPSFLIFSNPTFFFLCFPSFPSICFVCILLSMSLHGQWPMHYRPIFILQWPDLIQGEGIFR